MQFRLDSEQLAEWKLNTVYLQPQSEGLRL